MHSNGDKNTVSLGPTSIWYERITTNDLITTREAYYRSRILLFGSHAGRQSRPTSDLNKAVALGVKGLVNLSG